MPSPWGRPWSLSRKTFARSSDAEPYGEHYIDASRLLRFTWDQEGANFTGLAPLRSAYGPWKTKLTEQDVRGVWLGFGVGAPKQYFIIKRYGNGLRGIACGRCDNPYTLATLEDFSISGDTLTFYTLHEDWGPGSLPFRNRFLAHITENEMRIATQQENMPEAEPRFGSSLVGPISIEATAGNN